MNKNLKKMTANAIREEISFLMSDIDDMQNELEILTDELGRRGLKVWKKP